MRKVHGYETPLTQLRLKAANCCCLLAITISRIAARSSDSRYRARATHYAKHVTDLESFQIPSILLSFSPTTTVRLAIVHANDTEGTTRRKCVVAPSRPQIVGPCNCGGRGRPVCCRTPVTGFHTFGSLCLLTLTDVVPTSCVHACEPRSFC
ncbi:hypothetical protein EVAR_100561_1 [Eumeta japonica]|uniref:Uncharacterized protein n=1 Tax=Eumeta variegata TaxID=151549 RepID=A0A4C2A272_EUMVA|nr:hypothetical protein EVAR_100561_1 [Eumeta japonica]